MEHGAARQRRPLGVREQHGEFSQGGVSFPFTLAPAGAAPADDATFTDPEGFYTVPLPANWTAEARDGYVVLAGPDARVRVYLLSLPTTDVDAALATAWQQVDPAFEQKVVHDLTPPAGNGIDAMRVLTYDAGPERVTQVAVRVAGDRAYVLIFDGELAAAVERQSQLLIIDTGFRVLGLSADDISGKEPRPLTPELVAELEAFVADAIERAGVPGLAIAVVQDGELVYSNGFGVRELGGSEPVTPDTLMMIGSTGKTMTTMLMAALVDAGALAWDTPVVDVLPEFRLADPELTRQITVRHLVCACTGVPRRDFEVILNAGEMSAEDTIASLADFRLFTGFGEAFQYSNQMVAAGGYAAAAADGAEHGALFDGWLASMRARVFEPIGMRDTLVRPEGVLARDDVAVPHGMNLDGSYRPLAFETERVVLPVAPAGAAWSTVRDMGRYLVTELSLGVAPDGERVVSEANLRETWQPQVPIDASTHYALGWMVGEYKGLELISHGGATLGFTSDLTFLHAAGLGVSVLANASGASAVTGAVRTRLFELVFDLEPEAPEQLAYGLESQRQLLAASAHELHAVDADAVEAFLGDYRHPALGGLTLRLEAGTLVVDFGEFDLELGAVDADSARFVATSPPFAGFEYALETRDGAPVVVMSPAGLGEAYVFEQR